MPPITAAAAKILLIIVMEISSSRPELAGEFRNKTN